MDGNPAAPDGVPAAFMQFTGSINQAVSMSAGSHTIDFLAAQRGNYNQGGQSLRLLIDGVAVGSLFTPSSSSYVWETATFSVSAGTHIVTIVGFDPLGGNNTALVSDVFIH